MTLPLREQWEIDDFALVQKQKSVMMIIKLDRDGFPLRLASRAIVWLKAAGSARGQVGLVGPSRHTDEKGHHLLCVRTSNWPVGWIAPSECMISEENPLFKIELSNLVTSDVQKDINRS